MRLHGPPIPHTRLVFNTPNMRGMNLLGQFLDVNYSAWEKCIPLQDYCVLSSFGNMYWLAMQFCSHQQCPDHWDPPLQSRPSSRGVICGLAPLSSTSWVRDDARLPLLQPPLGPTPMPTSVPTFVHASSLLLLRWGSPSHCCRRGR